MFEISHRVSHQKQGLLDIPAGRVWSESVSERRGGETNQNTDWGGDQEGNNKERQQLKVRGQEKGERKGAHRHGLITGYKVQHSVKGHHFKTTLFFCFYSLRAFSSKKKKKCRAVLSFLISIVLICHLLVYGSQWGNSYFSLFVGQFIACLPKKVYSSHFSRQNSFKINICIATIM